MVQVLWVLRLLLRRCYSAAVIVAALGKTFLELGMLQLLKACCCWLAAKSCLLTGVAPAAELNDDDDDASTRPI
jgi:hypothetical protein